jgi:ABC-type branched-subunit amino acid transport system ATPase component
MDWNGVDKTTLVNVLVGFATPRHGKILFKGMGKEAFARCQGLVNSTDICERER